MPLRVSFDFNIYFLPGYNGSIGNAANAQRHIQLVHEDVRIFSAKRCNVEGSWRRPSRTLSFKIVWLIHLLNGYFNIFPECSATQPESPQVFCARGEREGSRVDGGRGGVPEEEVPEDDRLQVEGLHWHLVFFYNQTHWEFRCMSLRNSSGSGGIPGKSIDVFWSIVICVIQSDQWR